MNRELHSALTALSEEVERLTSDILSQRVIASRPEGIESKEDEWSSELPIGGEGAVHSSQAKRNLDPTPLNENSNGTDKLSGYAPRVTNRSKRSPMPRAWRWFAGVATRVMRWLGIARSKKRRN